MKAGFLMLASFGLASCWQTGALPVGQAPDWAFEGRFIQVWGTSHVGEITNARRRDGDAMSTEVVLARAPGQLMEDGVEVAVMAFRLRITCDPLDYKIDRVTRVAQDGRVLASENVTENAVVEPEGPYMALVRELCADGAPDRMDFTSLDAFRAEGLSRFRAESLSRSRIPQAPAPPPTVRPA